MPDKDGYEVCQFIKQHEQLAKIPVILMSGVVNRTVAEKAIAVKADELIRKPFQPQDLIARVKNLLHPKTSASQTGASQQFRPPRCASAEQSLFGNFHAFWSLHFTAAARRNSPRRLSITSERSRQRRFRVQRSTAR